MASELSNPNMVPERQFLTWYQSFKSQQCSCNGVLLSGEFDLKSSSNLDLYNPSTRKHKAIVRNTKIIKSWVSIRIGCEYKNYKRYDETAKLFPTLFGQPSPKLVPGDPNESEMTQSLKIGVVLSGGQAPGGHIVLSGIFDYLQERCKRSIMYEFKGGPAGIMKCKYVELNPGYIYP